MSDNVEVEEETAVRRRGRPAREQETLDERVSRKRAQPGTNDAIYGRWPKEAFDLKRYEYYTANDENDRVFNLTQNDDYDIFGPESDIKFNDREKVDPAGVYRQRVGTRVDGAPLYAYLLRKPKKFAEQHRAEKESVRRAAEDAQKGTGGKEAPDKSYRPREVK